MNIHKLPFAAAVAAFIFSLSACVTSRYVGDQHSPTDSVDVYYAAQDVKRDYKVIGHISSPVSMSEEASKAEVITRGKKVGADGVIILKMEYAGGKYDDKILQADAIKYTDGPGKADSVKNTRSSN